MNNLSLLKLYTSLKSKRENFIHYDQLSRLTDLKNILFVFKIIEANNIAQSYFSRIHLSDVKSIKLNASLMRQLMSWAEWCIPMYTMYLKVLADNIVM